MIIPESVANTNVRRTTGHVSKMEIINALTSESVSSEITIKTWPGDSMNGVYGYWFLYRSCVFQPYTGKEMSVSLSICCFKRFSLSCWAGLSLAFKLKSIYDSPFHC